MRAMAEPDNLKGSGATSAFDCRKSWCMRTIDALSPKALPALVIGLFASLLASCAGSGHSTIAYALDGPALFMRGEYDNTPVKGTLDRSIMVGVGSIRFELGESPDILVCEGTLNTPPSENGRVRGVAPCENGQVLLFTLRNLGPDQGVGIGRITDKDNPVIVFFHASDEEAARRFPEVLQDIHKARQATSSPSEQQPAPASAPTS